MCTLLGYNNTLILSTISMCTTSKKFLAEDIFYSHSTMSVMGKLSSLGAVLLSLVVLFFLSHSFGQIPGHTLVLTQLDSVFGVYNTGYPHYNHNYHHHRYHSYIARSRILRRADSTCGPDRLCENGACCSLNGYCGYRDDFCGDGCVSNCDAAAECGQYVEPASKLCPLNTCYSEFGFCGTTEVSKVSSLYGAILTNNYYRNSVRVNVNQTALCI